MLDDQEFYSAKELADRLGVTETTIYRMVRAGKLACYHIGRAKRFHRDDIIAFLRSVRSTGPESDEASSE